MDWKDLLQSGASPVEGLGKRLKKQSYRAQRPLCCVLCRGVAKLVKASDFDSDMRGFESFLPCQTATDAVDGCASYNESERAHSAVFNVARVCLFSRRASFMSKL